MNCQDFENRLPDALGGELAESDQARFDAHLSDCEKCRDEYDSLKNAVGRMQSLPEPGAVAIRRIGDGLFLTPSNGIPARAPRWTQRSRTLLRYAAVILLAFIAGYSTSSFNTVTPRVTPPPFVAVGGNPAGNLQTAVAMQFSRNPTRSDLAKGLLAMYESR